MDVTNRFSIVDFLAYLFPGVVGALGSYIILLLTPLKDKLQHLPTDLATGILFLTVSFIFGVISSGVPGIIIKWWHLRDREQIKGSIQTKVFESEILAAFHDLLKLGSEDNIGVKWSSEHFYLCRSIVLEKMPSCGQLILRQNGLRQLRMNMIVPILIWFFAGFIWGANQIHNGKVLWGIALILTSLLLTPLSLFSVVNRMVSNERREVRGVLLAFLIGYKTGFFDKSNKDTKLSTPPIS